MHKQLSGPRSEDSIASDYFEHSSAQRVNTDAALVSAIRAKYPHLHLTIVPLYTCDLLYYAAAGKASVTPVSDNSETGLKWTNYIPPTRRLEGERGRLEEEVLFGKYEYNWEGHSFIVYLIDGDPYVKNQYVLSPSAQKNDELVFTVASHQEELHNQVWVYKGGYWRKSRDLWEGVQKSRWEDVILDEDMKKAIIGDVVKFFDSKDTYGKLGVPWKRGVIFHGPPGNGKTISIKAMMYQLYKRKDPIPTLYVRSLSSYGGPEYSISEIFNLARRTAPCYLVFEDLDSMISPSVRSYFLNEVDGLAPNDGIFMVGSTNHLELLDPGIAKRPSRFDRKYFFPDPNEEQRTKYCQFWRKKLSDNEEVEFPSELCPAIAKITSKFSFAYIQEAFVATLLALAVAGDSAPPNEEVSRHGEHALSLRGLQTPSLSSGLSEAMERPAQVESLWQRWEMPARLPPNEQRPDLDKYVLWREIKKQVKLLKDELNDERTVQAGSSEKTATH